MSALRERLVSAGRGERAPDGLRRRVLRSAAAAVGTGLLAGFGKLGAALAFVALAATGTVAYSVTHSSSEAPALRIAEPLRPSDLHRGTAPTAAMAPSAPIAPRAAAPTLTASSRPVASPPAPARSSLAAEVQALDEARTALNRGDAVGANATLARYRRTFPAPLLGEEASVLEIEALARGGSLPQARARLQKFRIAHPTSPALGRLGRIVGEP